MNKPRETELRFAEPDLNLALASAGIGVWEFDALTKALACSSECKAHFGYGPEQDFSYQEWTAAVHPEDRARWDLAMQQAMTEREPFALDYRTVWPDGQVHWIHLRGAALEGRNVLSGCSLARDGASANSAGEEDPKLRAAFHAEAARHESEERFRFTFEEAALGMAHVGLDGRWLRINRKLCEILGYTREELLYMTFQDITYPEDLEADTEHLKKLLEGSAQRYSVEKRYIRKDGTLVWVNLTASLLRDAEGTPLYFISVLEDISARKEMEEAVALSYNELESQVAKRTSALRMLSNRLMHLQDEERRRIARELHDSVGQYMTAIAINLDLLARPEGQNRNALIGETRQLLNHSLSEIRTLSHLLHPPLLDEAGLNSAAQWYVEGFARRSNIAIELDMPPLERLPANIEITLFRVLQESLNNIHRHSQSTRAKVSVHCDAGQVRLEVRDFGNGIEAERLERFRNSGTGVGVGLAGIRERVSELGGNLEIVSNKGGTTVKVWIPLPAAGEQNSAA